MNGGVRNDEAHPAHRADPNPVGSPAYAGLVAFLTSIASSVLGLTVFLLALLSVVEFIIGYWKNSIAFAVLALIASPVGLPGLANLTLDGLDLLLGFLEGLLAA